MNWHAVDGALAGLFVFGLVAVAISFAPLWPIFALLGVAMLIGAVANLWRHRP